jgi:hypothetical protein
MSYKDKLKEKEYQNNIPIELKRLYEKTYLITDKGKAYKREKNRRYREKVLLSKPIDEYNQTNS